MIEIRIHGRGGQGNVVAAYLLATAAFEAGRHAQAFPNFGAERRGAPVTAFVRIADRPIRRRCQVLHPAWLIVQDENLLHLPDISAGLLEGGAILANSTRDGSALAEQLGCTVVTLPATRLALDVLGKPVPNTALLSAFLALTGLLPQDALLHALAGRFHGDVLERNRELIIQAAALVEAGTWQEATHAARA
jgi:pyruvate ferredoxin oxidoreductase gamma subunit